MRAIGYPFAAALWIVAACGGNSFTTGPAGADAGDSKRDSGGPALDASGGSPDGSSAESGGPDASSAEAGDAAVFSGSGIPCGAKACSGTLPVCCLGTTPSCSHVLGCQCATAINCASNADCDALNPVCCIAKRGADTSCATTHTTSRCEIGCGNGAVQMCNPAARTPTCPSGQVCSTDSGDLSNAGLPANDGYGVCK
jgi:hypothetical protein